MWKKKELRSDEVEVGNDSNIMKIYEIFLMVKMPLNLPLGLPCGEVSQLLKGFCGICGRNSETPYFSTKNDRFERENHPNQTFNSWVSMLLFTKCTPHTFHTNSIHVWYIYLHLS